MSKIKNYAHPLVKQMDDQLNDMLKTVKKTIPSHNEQRNAIAALCHVLRSSDKKLSHLSDDDLVRSCKSIFAEWIVKESSK